MAEDDAQAAAVDQRTFDLQASDGVTTSRGVIVTATALRWSGGECPFEDIVTIKLLCDTSDELNVACSILRTNEARLTIENTRRVRHESAIYRDFLQSFVEQLGPVHRARIAFWPLDQGSPALIWGALLAISVAMLIWALITNQIAAAPENVYILPVVGLLTPLFVLLFWKSLHRPAPKPIAPDRLEAFMPPTYYDRF